MRKQSDNEVHSHAPNREEVAAEKVLSGVKRRATDHPEAPPAQIIRALNDLPPGVFAELPDRENVKKTIRRQRLTEMPSNPTTIQDLREIPHKFTVTLQHQPFLIYDSLQDDDCNDSQEKIIIYTTRENLRLLFQSRIWYVDGTFKSAPAIFFQLFVVMGSILQKTHRGDQLFALPFVYASLESKNTAAYKKVFNVIISEATKFGIQRSIPEIIMSDFELAIINAVQNTSISTGDNIKACFFHLSQNIFRRIQAEGLQARYNSIDDRSIKLAAHQMCALAFVPVDDVVATFDLIEFPDDFLPIADYFEVLLL